MKATDFFTHFAQKAGIDTSEKSFADFLKANESLEIPDAFATEAQNKLMNEDDAKKSPVIAGHFKSQTLSGVDTELERLLSDLQLDDETKGFIKAEKSTFKRVPLLIQKVKELEAKKADAGKGDKADLVKKINDLNAEILKITDDAKKSVEAERTAAASQIDDFALKAYLGQKSYANEKASKRANILTAMHEINEKLNGKGKIVRDGDNFKLVDASSPDLPFRNGHTDIQFDSFVDKTLGEAGLLKVSEPTKPGNHTPQPVYTGSPLKENDAAGQQELQEFYAREEAAFSKNGSH